MTAMEKVAWTELLVSAVTVIVVSALFPWLGSGAHVGFALLVFLVVSLWFLRRRGRSVIVDERDRDIGRNAMHQGMGVAWMFLWLALIGMMFWSSLFNDHMVPTRLVTWVIWVQFAMCYGVKGFVAVRAYRRQSGAT